MKTSTFFYVIIPFVLFFTQINGQQKVQKTITAQKAVPLKEVTAGFSIGYGYLFENPYDYFLTTDNLYKLQLQQKSRSNFVISTVISIRLGRPALQQQTINGETHKKIVSLNTEEREPQDGTLEITAGSAPVFKPKKSSHWTLNIGLNLVDISSDVTFNKSIDGGLGLGYMINEFSQIAMFIDMVRYRQLRDYIIENYRDKSIPNGSNTLNALDEKDNNLFHNNYIPGLSLKLIFTLNNQ